MPTDAPDEVDEFGIPIIPGLMDLSQRRQHAITEAALAEFLRAGYSAASMDAITARAGVSKPTIYRYYGSKETLFLAVIGGVLPKTYNDLQPLNTTLGQAPDLRMALITLASNWTRILIRDDINALRRLVIGEVDRFPQLASLWYRVSYDMNNGPLIKAFTELDERGVLDVPDPVLATQQLVASTAGVLQLVKMFDPKADIDDAELSRVITSGVDLFLARYSKQS